MSLNLVPNPWPIRDGTESPSVTLHFHRSPSFLQPSLPPPSIPFSLSSGTPSLPPPAVSFLAPSSSFSSSFRRSNSVRPAPQSLSSGLRAPSCGRPQQEREEWRERRRIDDELGILLLSLSPRSAMESAWREGEQVDKGRKIRIRSHVLVHLIIETCRMKL